MAKGKKTGGRVRGVSINSATRTLREKAEALGVDPFTVLLMFSKGDWKGLGYPAATRVYFTPQGLEVVEDIIKPDARLKAASEATQYLEPKRKAIEHTGANGGPIETREMSALTDEQLNEQIKAKLAKVGLG